MAHKANPWKGAYGMRSYELMVVLRADLSDEDRSALFDQVAKWIDNGEGEIASIDHWGRRRLAYEIDGQRDGYYAVYDLNLPPSAPADLERNLLIHEDVLRHLLTRRDD